MSLNVFLTPSRKKLINNKKLTLNSVVRQILAVDTFALVWVASDTSLKTFTVILLTLRIFTVAATDVDAALHLNV